MFIPTWLLIGIAVGIAVWLLNFRGSAQKGESLSIERMWQLATEAKNDVLEHSHLMHVHLEDEREMVAAMELDAMRLRERFKHDKIKQAEIARDWMDYANAVSEVKDAREFLDVDMSEKAILKFHDKVAEPHIRILEIGKRITSALGSDSQLAAVITRIEREQELPLDERMKLVGERGETH